MLAHEAIATRLRPGCVVSVGAFAYGGTGWLTAPAFATMGAFSALPGLGQSARAATTVFPPQTFTAENQASAMLETNPIHHLIKDLSERADVLRGYL